jgi:hypothetical protein
MWARDMQSSAALPAFIFVKRVWAEARAGNKLHCNPRLQMSYAYPGVEDDVLFDSAFLHVDGRECTQICYNKANKIVRRPQRSPLQDNPAIWYSLIASADKLMKDAERRDELSRTEQVLCFEMEALGLMNSFPFLVIRGICDYSDIHKNDLWQALRLPRQQHTLRNCLESFLRWKCLTYGRWHLLVFLRVQGSAPFQRLDRSSQRRV